MKNFDMPNTLLMSDSLKEKLSLNEEEMVQIEDSFIIAAISFANYKVVVGSLAGVSFEETSLKIDVKISLQDAHDVLTNLAIQESRSIDMIEFHYKSAKQINKKYNVSIIRISEIDHANKMAILALDLIKTT